MVRVGVSKQQGRGDGGQAGSVPSTDSATPALVNVTLWGKKVPVLLGPDTVYPLATRETVTMGIKPLYAVMRDGRLVKVTRDD